MRILFITMAMLAAFAGHSQRSHTIYFDFNRYALKEKEQAKLDSFLTAQAKQPGEMLLSLDGYCDFTGSDKYNDRLSMNRVLAVRNYLLRYGVKAGNMEDITGHGEKDLLNENRTEEERQLNRRVIISIGKKETGHVVAGKTITEKIADSTVTIGSNIVLQNISFIGGRHQLLEESAPVLNELLQAMKTYPGLIIGIEGHVCCVDGDWDGEDTETGLYNLSLARARAIREYLIANGIDGKRITYKGFGHSLPLFPYPEKTEEERKLNRRVEIKILRK